MANAVTIRGRCAGAACAGRARHQARIGGARLDPVARAGRLADRPARDAGVRTGHLVLAAALLLSSAAGASAQVEPGDVGGFTRLGHFPTFLPFECLDTQNVRIMPTLRPLLLPGQRGRDLIIEYAPGAGGYRIVGVPSSVSDGQYGYAYGSYEALVQQLLTIGPRLSMGDGSTRRMYYETWPRPTPEPDPVTGVDPTYRYALSTDRLRWDAVTHVLHFPDGRWCHYGEGGPPMARRLTSCADAFGPYLTVSYPTSTSRVIRQILEGSPEAPAQYREVVIDGGSLQYEGRVWTAGGTSLLRTFHTPGVSTPWTFESQNRTSSVDPYPVEILLTKVTTPGGGEIAYEYQEPTSTIYVPQPDGSHQPVVVSHGWFLASRMVSGPDVASGTWTFSDLAFEHPVDRAPTTFQVTAPPAGTAAGLVTTYWNARATTETPEGYLVGPGWITSGQTTATSSRGTDFTDRVLVEYPAGQPMPWSITLATLAPRLTGEAVCDPQAPAVCTGYSLERDAFDDFGNATRLVERASSRPGVERVTETTYLNQAGYGDLYLLGLPETTTVSVGSDVVTTTRSHNAATGFLNWIEAAGVRTDFAPDARGNIAAATLAPSQRRIIRGYVDQRGGANLARNPVHSVYRLYRPLALSRERRSSSPTLIK